MSKIQEFFNNFDGVKENVFNSNVGEIKKIAEPYITGYSFIKFYPGQILLDEMGVNINFFTLMEKTFKEFSGMNSIELETTSMQGGFTGTEHIYPSGISRNLTEVTLKFQELSGSIYTDQFKRWVESIRDPYTGLYQLSKYGLKYYSVSMLYIVANPSIGSHSAETRKNAVETAGLFTQMYPKKIDNDKYNFSSNSHDLTELDQTFACQYYEGVEIKRFAQENVVGTAEFYENLQKSRQSLFDSNIEGLDNRNINYPPNAASVTPNSTPLFPDL